MFATVASILIATIIGMIDDMLGWRTGIRQSKKVLLTFLIPVPLMVINAGQNTMAFPFLGTIDIGLLYPLLIVPVGIIGASNAFNMLAGFFFALIQHRQKRERYFIFYWKNSYPVCMFYFI
ncbi:MAG: hypothetical protein KKD69_00910 [Euryarchaeota archaeon]|nr:hypothetical protein [Euryarchaeota archaeon]MBU4491008.1 hypothetical protein [Euryarchaeota archaeon]